MPGCSQGQVPIVRMFGVTMDGHSVLCNVHGFLPYYYIPAPSNFQQSDCSLFRVSIYVCLTSKAAKNFISLC